MHALRPRHAAVILPLLGGVAACAPSTPVETAAPAAPAPSARERVTFSETGVASWYGKRHQGAKTASGERFDPKDLTAAHRTLPMGTRARVTALDGGQSVTVRINDRGPRTRNRIIDLSAQAADSIGLRDDGVGEVRIEVFPADQ
jgi:rare lipoprotein A